MPVDTIQDLETENDQQQHAIGDGIGGRGENYQSLDSPQYLVRASNPVISRVTRSKGVIYFSGHPRQSPGSWR
jgi:hypothetical protein